MALGRWSNLYLCGYGCRFRSQAFLIKQSGLDHLFQRGRLRGRCCQLKQIVVDGDVLRFFGQCDRRRAGVNDMDRCNALGRVCRRRGADAVDLLRRLVEGLQDMITKAGRCGMIAGGVDCIDLGLQQGADATVRAGFTQSPRDLPDHPRAFARRSQRVVKSRASQCGRNTCACGGDDGANRGHCFRQFVGGLRSLLFLLLLLLLFCLLGSQRALDTRDGFQHHGGVRVAVALCVLVQKPAAARGLQKRLADSLEVRVAW